MIISKGWFVCKYALPFQAPASLGAGGRRSGKIPDKHNEYQSTYNKKSSLFLFQTVINLIFQKQGKFK